MLIGAGNQAFAGDFTVVTNTAPPIKYIKDGMVTGIAGDILVEIMSRAGLKLDKEDILPISLVEGYEITRTRPNTLCVSLARTPNREADFKWVGPTYSTQMGFIAKTDRHIQLKSADDAKQYTISSVVASAPEAVLFDRGFTESDFLRHIEPLDAVKSLASGKADLAALPKSPAYEIMMQADINPHNYEMVYAFKTVPLYIALNKGTSDDVVAKLQAALDEIKRPAPDGTSVYSRIVSKYFTPNM